MGRLEADPVQSVADYLRHKMEMSLEITAGTAMDHMQVRESTAPSSHSMVTTEAGAALRNQGESVQE